MVDVALRALGKDKITIEVLEMLEPDWGKVTRLVNKDLRAGRASMKEAELVLIPKQGKDASTVKGWRPVSLLSVVSKGVERAVAGWLGTTGLVEGWFGQGQAGGIPGRSTTDIVLRMLAEVEKDEDVDSWKAVVLMDVKGAFNAARKDYVYKVLRDKGVLENIVKWTVDFMSDREIFPRRGET